MFSLQPRASRLKMGVSPGEKMTPHAFKSESYKFSQSNDKLDYHNHDRGIVWLVSTSLLYCVCYCSINMSIKRGDLVAVVGVVGSGKSSLMQALMGEMMKRQGSVKIKVPFSLNTIPTFSLHDSFPWFRLMSLVAFGVFCGAGVGQW